MTPDANDLRPYAVIDLNGDAELASEPEIPGAKEPTGQPAHPIDKTPGDVAGNMLISLVGNLFPPMAMLVTAPILAHGLGVDGRGAVAAAAAPLTLAITAATFGIPDAMTYLIARNPRTLRAATRVGSTLIIATALLVTVGVILAAHWLSGGVTDAGKLVVVAAFAITPTLLIAVVRAGAAGLHRWRLVSIERFLSAFTRLVVLVALASTGHLTPLSATLATAFGPLVGVLAYLPMRSSLSATVTSQPVTVRDLSGFGLRLWVGAISGILLSRLDQTIMAPLAGIYELGIYSVAATVADVPLIVNSAVREVTFSADAAQATDARLGTSARISAFVSAVVGLILLLTMFWWLPLAFGREFSPAMPSTAILIASAVLGTPGSIAGAGLSARGRPGLRSASLVVACVVSVVILLVLTPSMGAIGASIATLVGALLASNSNIFFLWRFYRMPPTLFWGIRRSDLQTMVRFGCRICRQLRHR